MSTTQIDRLRGLLEPLVAERGLDLEELTVTPAGKRRVLRVVVDSDEGVQLDACAELSRALSAALDADDPMGSAPYVLEVTSPGADRPLTEQRHYRRAVGRLVALRLHEGGDLTARLLSVDEEGLDLEVPGVKGRKPTRRRVEFAQIARARVEIEFNRPKASGDGPAEGTGGPAAHHQDTEHDENEEEA
ncbi:ribosome maturation factor RimP [Streptomyces sp. TRM 70351]|uniref:ribosome maturation factor RimP n=1 Tax=Streptomyces sp. TRM 70351 TaxID=3116552 RepID=UPI002E7B24FA|nr:ribosome maturation factor RimP [Streptomyces sp. TRM 70351]MEE1931067.1 ribosome maturation factor RimP [Streptomyces sp. TRM 70351]